MSDTHSRLTAEIEDSNPSSLSVRGWDLVDLGQRGAAKDASEDIVPLMEEAVGEQTLFVLPRGRYLVDSEFDPSGWDRIGIVGRPHAELVVTDIDQTFGRCFDLSEDGASEAWVENLTFDFTKDGVGPAVAGIEVEDSLLVRNVNVDGRCDYILREGRGSSCIYLNVTDPDGVGVVENLNIPDGSAFDKELHDADELTPGTGYVRNDWGLIGINVYPSHEGTLRFVDCTVCEWPDAGLYAKRSGGNGKVIVEGGHFENNGAAGVRLSHADEMHGGHIVKRQERGWIGPGLWLQEGEPTVRDVTITAYRWGSEVLRITSAGATLDNVTIATSIDTRTIRASGTGTGVMFSNVSFRHFGQGAGDYGIIIRRGDVTFRDTDFRYVAGVDSDDLKNLVYANQPVRFVDCDFDTPEAGLRLDGPGSDVRGCRFNDSEIHLSGNGHERLLCEQNRLKEANLNMSGGTRSEVLERNLLE